MQKLYKQIYVQVLFFIILGVLLGYFYPEFAKSLKPLGDSFIRLVRMMVAPIIFVTVVTGIASMREGKSVGRIGLKSLIYFEIMTTFALIIGLLIANIYKPGAGLNIDINSLNSNEISHYIQAAPSSANMVEFFIHIIPNSLVSAFVDGDILSVLLIALLFGFALLLNNKKASSVFVLLDQLSILLFTIMRFIMKVAPLGAFGAMAYTVGAYGIDTLLSLGKLVISVYLTSFFFIVLVLGGLSRWLGFSLWNFLKYIKEEIFIVLGTSSSEVVLPRMMTKLEKLGCNKSITRLVLPTGYTFNLDGTSIYLTIAILFIAQSMNISLSLYDQVMIIAILLIMSKGAAAVSGGGFIVLAAALSSIEAVPVEGIVLVLGVDRFMAEIRALTNLIGNGIATLVIAKWENALNVDKARQFSVVRCPT